MRLLLLNIGHVNVYIELFSALNWEWPMSEAGHIGRRLLTLSEAGHIGRRPLDLDHWLGNAVLIQLHVLQARVI